MAQKLTDAIVKGLHAPASGNRIEYDAELKGFGCRITAAGARSFILNYRTRSGRERRYTIGQHPAWKVAAARTEAARLKHLIDLGGDPLADLELGRTAPTVADLCARYETDHLPKKRASSQRDDRSKIARDILPALRHRKLAEVTFTDVDTIHRAITARGSPYAANRTVALLSKMFSLAERWGWIPKGSNPAQGIERNQEVKRHRYLAADELERLTEALAKHPDQHAANIIRLLLLTGARRGEVLAARWDQFDLTIGVWVKPGATTKQKTDHRVPLSAPARRLLSDLYAEAGEGAEHVFPGGRDNRHRVEIKRAWRDLCKAAAIDGARMHDLRHTYASMLASANISLPTIGALLGHTQPQTTARYAHLFDDPLRAATERVGALVERNGSADVTPLVRGTK
jgi:integrase